MIDAHELRIGNIIHNGFKPVVVHGLDAEGIILMMQPTSMSLGWGGRRETEYSRLYLGYEVADPSPLTAEILEKCGFRDVTAEQYDFPTYENHLGDRISFDGGIYKYWLGGIYCDWAELRALHRLQNFFFEYNNQELEVKL